MRGIASLLTLAAGLVLAAPAAAADHPISFASYAYDPADVTIAVNIMSRETLPAWPGQEAPPATVERKGMRMLETLLEVMDVSQLDTSTRHAALADVVITRAVVID